MFKVFEMTDFCNRSSTLRALAPSSFLTDFSRRLARVTTQYVNYDVVLFNPVTIVSLLQLPHHGPILEYLFLIFLSSTLNPWAAHFNCADFFPLVADKSRVDPISSNTRGVIIIIISYSASTINSALYYYYYYY